MRIPQGQTFDIVQFKQDKAAYDYWFSRQFDDGGDDDLAEKVSATIFAAVRLELSEKQRDYFTRYYFEGLTMQEISNINCVNKSTVVRTIARARTKLERVLKYVDPKLMRLFEGTDKPTKIRRNTAGRQRYKMNGVAL